MKYSIKKLKEKLGLNNHLIQRNEVEINENDYYKVEGHLFTLYTMAELRAKGIPTSKIIARINRREVR